MRPKDITVGMRFGFLVVLAPPFRARRGQSDAIFCRCQCDCGAMHTTRAWSLIDDKAQSCGCQTSAILIAQRTQHGHNRAGHSSRLYRMWNSMQQRCENPKHPSWKDYGGRGICLCTEWHMFIPFMSWALSHDYDDAKQIDRINNDGDYEPTNCRFVTCAENHRNTRRNVWMMAFGERKCLTDWVKDPRCAVKSTSAIKERLLRGFSPENALTQAPIDGLAEFNKARSARFPKKSRCIARVPD